MIEKSDEILSRVRKKSKEQYKRSGGGRVSDKSNNKTKGYALERYKLVLTHEFIDDKGVPHKLDLPLTVQQVVEHNTRRQYGHAVFVNEMLERMREAVLNQTEISW